MLECNVKIQLLIRILYGSPCICNKRKIYVHQCIIGSKLSCILCGAILECLNDCYIFSFKQCWINYVVNLPSLWEKLKLKSPFWYYMLTLCSLDWQFLFIVRLQSTMSFTLYGWYCWEKVNTTPYEVCGIHCELVIKEFFKANKITLMIGVVLLVYI